MVLISGKPPIKTKKLSFDESKVKKHEVNPTGLELILSHNMGSVSIELGLGEYREGYITRVKLESFRRVYDYRTQQEPTPKQLEPIEHRYEEIAEMINRGEYILHLYGNGNIKVELLND